MTDLVTFGETMLRFSPPDDTPIETTDTFAVHAAGAESNVAIAAARLGTDAAWLSKLPDSPPGRRVTSSLRRHGVDPAVVWADEGRQGTYYLESGQEPRGTTVIYDRDGAAIQTATTTELATDRVEAAELFHTSGITPALSETLETTTGDLLELAQENGTTTVFDLNYRSKLWSPAQARETLTDLFKHVDLLVTAERDASTVLGRDEAAETVARDLAEEYDFETVIITQSSEGSIAYHDGTITEQPAFEATDAHPVGTGDALVGGFLAKRLQGERVPVALQYGTATAALKRTIPGDVAVVTPEAVDRVIAGSDREISR